MGRPLTFTDADIELIRRLAFKGVRVTEIAKKLNRSPKGIYCLMTRLGIPRQPKNKFASGSENPSWNGGRWIDKDGYVMVLVKNHPYQTRGGYVREHRLVMEKHLGRYLLPNEVVHHKDANKQNNDISNLELFHSNSAHLKHELTGRVPKWTEDGKRRIREGARRPALSRS